MEHDGRLDASMTDEGRYRLLLEAVTDYAIFMLDRNGVVTTWNPGAQRSKGYTAHEIIGQHFSRFYTEDDRNAGLPERALETAARQGKFEREAWRVRKDGSRFWAHVVIDPIRDSSGDVIGFAKITRDLTERKLAEEALKQSERNFGLLVQGVTDYAIFMLDPEGRVSSWNPGAHRIKGYRADEIVGRHFSRFYTDEDRQRGEPQKALETATRDGKCEMVGWRVRKDGTRFWAHVIIDAIRGDDGAIVGFAKITRDVTEQLAAQKALDQAREALFQSQKVEAVGQLTGGIAHDFNNILMAVLSGLELVRKRLPDDPKLVLLLDNVLQAAQRGNSLTQRMLAFARRQELTPEAVDVPALVHGLRDLLQRTLGPSVSIETRFPDGLDAVQADPHQLELALLNLTMNARDAMPDGGPIVIAAFAETLEAGHDSGLPSGRYVCISVADTGEGMDEQTLARATEPFFTTKGVGKGTGLGLSMVYGLAEQSGGRLHLKSAKGTGTTVDLWLPIAAQPGLVDRRKRPSVADTVPAARPLRILLVDDDDLVIMTTAAMLEDLGHTVYEAASGKEALEVFRRPTAIDLVITDQGMPNMTGVQLTAAIHAEDPGVPVILATGYAELPPGAVGTFSKLSKPFRQQELARAIEAASSSKAPKR